MIYTLPFLPFMMCLPWKRHEYRRKITEVIENIIKELKDALKTDDLIIEECNKILLELSTLAGELFREELKDIEQEVNEMAKMIIDPEIYRRGFEEGLEKGLVLPHIKQDFGDFWRILIKSKDF